jgi:hypothetical protein
MTDKELQDLKIAQKAELKEVLARRDKLSASEYVNLLLLIQKNYTVSMAIASLGSEVKGSAAMMHVIEKVHFLIDSALGKDVNSDNGIQTVDAELSDKHRERWRETYKDDYDQFDIDNQKSKPN